MLVPDFLRQQAERNPENTAIVLDGIGEITYGQWEQRSNRLARHLVNRGVQPGDRVANLFTNHDALTYVVSYMAVHKAGAVNVPLSPRLTVHEISHLLAHADASALLVGGHRADDIDVLSEKLEGCALTLGLDALDAAGLEGDGSAFQVERTEDDLADIIYTSGTTGLPKGVACTHANTTYHNAKSEMIFRGATFMHALPLYTFGGTQGMTLMPLRNGMKSVVMPKFDGTRFLELVAEHEVQVAYVVPSMVLLMLDSPRINAGGFDSLRFIMYGTAPMPPHAILGMAEVFTGAFLVNAYGCTESGVAVCTLPPDQATQRPESLGKPMPPTELRIVDDDDNELAAGEVGEICMRIPIKPRTYFKDPEASAQTFRSDGWVYTGDVGYLDEDGYLYLVDRKKDLVIRGGLNISAPEVEAALMGHPGVSEAAVIGVPHPVLGEDTHACVVAYEGEAPSAEELEAFLRERLADFKVPRQYTFMAALPRTEIGKVLKRDLREQLAPEGS